MHSSRMRTVRYSGRLMAGVCLSGGCLPSGGVCLPRWVSAQVGVCPEGVSTQGGGEWVSAWGCLPRGCTPPALPVDRILVTRL